MKKINNKKNVYIFASRNMFPEGVLLLEILSEFKAFPICASTLTGWNFYLFHSYFDDLQCFPLDFLSVICGALFLV